MNLAFYIARRYLFAKKSHNVINLISAISVIGIVVATIAMVCTLSVFNGFKNLHTIFFSFFDPDLKITAVEGKVFDPTTADIKAVCALSEVVYYCGVLQENALVVYNDRQEPAVLKGVDSTFRHLTQIDTAMIDGRFVLREGDIQYAVLGQGLASTLGVNAAFAHPVEIYMPERTGTINMANPTASFNIEYVFIGGVFHVNQPVYDEGFMLIPLDLLRSMLNYEKEVTALEIKIAQGVDVAALKKKIARLIGDGFVVKDRFEQQESFFKIIQVEKWVSYLMLCFILVLTLFNVLGSLAILMIEKEEDVSKLRSMGAHNRLINKIFLFEGWMISLLGASFGIATGIGLCLLQQHFGFITLGATAGAFLIDAYPVVVDWMDVFIVFITVVTIGFIAVLYPVHYMGKFRLDKRLVFCLLLPLMMTGCGGQSRIKPLDQTEEIAVSINPVCYFAQKIAGDDYVFFPVVPVGRSPETFDPSFREMMRVEKSAAFFHINRLGFEQLLIKALQANQKDTPFYDLSEGMENDRDDDDHESQNQENEDHDNAFSPGHGHHHDGHDPHIWTSFAGAKVMSENIFKALSSLNPARTAYYQANHLLLKEELEQLENELHQQLDTLSCRGFVIFHPALTYFAEEFGLIQYSLEEDGKDPTPATLKRVIEEARLAQVKVVFVQLEFDRSYAEQIAKETGGRIVMINPLDQQWDVQMRRIAKALVTDGKVD